jgi:excinuclease ABC subunit A
MGGGEVVAAGTPEDVVREMRSYTGQYLREVLKRGRKEAAE